MLTINLKELIKNYDDNLLNNLRGFGKENQFLNFWVPSTDHYKSFLNLIDALVESKINSVKIILEDEEENKIFIEKIVKYLSSISKFKKQYHQNITEFEIELDFDKYKNYLVKKKSLSYEKKEEVLDNTKHVNTFKISEKIKKKYLENLDLFNPKNYFTSDFIVNENSFLEQIEDIKINICISDHIIVKTQHNCRKNLILQKLINIFFEIILNKHIHEAADHGIIYLEEKIRVINYNIKNQGIILPDQAGSYFSILNKSIRNIFKKYKLKNNLNFDINKEYFQISNSWKITNEKEKFRKINEILKENSRNYDSLKSDSIAVNKIENDFKIYLNVDENFKKLQKDTNLLLRIEMSLKKLDDTLEVFVDEILDKNKLRLKNSPQNI